MVQTNNNKRVSENKTCMWQSNSIKLDDIKGLVPTWEKAEEQTCSIQLASRTYCSRPPFKITSWKLKISMSSIQLNESRGYILLNEIRDCNCKK